MDQLDPDMDMAADLQFSRTFAVRVQSKTTYILMIDIKRNSCRETNETVVWKKESAGEMDGPITGPCVASWVSSWRTPTPR